ncbi:hypothetical protein K1719_030361 [Acacia pycnantha]|nr:hypothetical protein K1719_030361 [Acacia pycnantha]
MRNRANGGDRLGPHPQQWCLPYEAWRNQKLMNVGGAMEDELVRVVRDSIESESPSPTNSSSSNYLALSHRTQYLILQDVLRSETSPEDKILLLPRSQRRDPSSIIFYPGLMAVFAVSSDFQDNSKYARFRYQGLEFCEELEIIFGGTMATSQRSWTLATGALSEDSAIKTNSTILEEIAEYDEEEINPDEDACHMVNNQLKRKKMASEALSKKLAKRTTGDLTKGRRKLGDVRQGRPDRKGSGNQSSESIGAEFGEHHRPSSSPFDEFESREHTRGVNAASPFFLDRKPDPRVELSGAYWNQRGRRDPTLSPGISRTFLGHQQDKLGPEIP